MATHSSVLAWRIPGTAGCGGLPSMGSHRVRHDWSDLAAAIYPRPKVSLWERAARIDAFQDLPRSATRATVPLCWILLTFPGTAQQWNFSAYYPAIGGSLQTWGVSPASQFLPHMHPFLSGHSSSLSKVAFALSLCSALLLLLLFGHCLRVPCLLLAPWPGIEPVPPAVEAQSPYHWTPQGSLSIYTLTGRLSLPD